MPPTDEIGKTSSFGIGIPGPFCHKIFALIGKPMQDVLEDLNENLAANSQHLAQCPRQILALGDSPL